jgi:hypothetical protein
VQTKLSHLPQPFSREEPSRQSGSKITLQMQCEYFDMIYKSKCTHSVYSIAYFEKGWTNREIGVKWIKFFDQKTHKKQIVSIGFCLYVNEHNSHYTQGFLEYAHAHQIIVFCYPAHTTHLLQGLDVVVFAVLKRMLSDEHDCWECEMGEMVNKSNFLGIYGWAHLHALHQRSLSQPFERLGSGHLIETSFWK